jgi:hypothetical protein
VVQSAWHFAVGEKWDKSALKELRAGDYAWAPKGSTMVGYCPEGAVVQVAGVSGLFCDIKSGVSWELSDPLVRRIAVIGYASAAPSGRTARSKSTRAIRTGFLRAIVTSRPKC